MIVWAAASAILVLASWGMIRDRDDGKLEPFLCGLGIAVLIEAWVVLTIWSLVG